MSSVASAVDAARVGLNLYRDFQDRRYKDRQRQRKKNGGNFRGSQRKKAWLKDYALNNQTTSTVEQIGYHVFSGCKAPFRERVFRSMFKPVRVQSRSAYRVFSPTSGCAAVQEVPFLQPSKFESDSVSALNTIPQLLDLPLVLSNAYNDAGNTISNFTGSGIDGGYWIENEFVKHDLWNNTIIPYVVEFYVVEPKMENLNSSPLVTWNNASAYESAGVPCVTSGGATVNFNGNTLPYDDVSDHPTQHKFFNSQWKVVKKVKKTLAPGEHGFFYVRRGRRFVSYNHITQGYPGIPQTNAIGSTRINQYKSLSYYCMVRVVGLTVKDTTLNAITTSPVDVNWIVESSYTVMPQFVQNDKNLVWGAGSQTSTQIRGPLSDNYGFINQTTDAVVSVAGNSASGGVWNEL